MQHSEQISQQPLNPEQIFDLINDSLANEKAPAIRREVIYNAYPTKKLCESARTLLEEKKRILEELVNAPVPTDLKNLQGELKTLQGTIAALKTAVTALKELGKDNPAYTQTQQQLDQQLKLQGSLTQKISAIKEATDPTSALALIKQTINDIDSVIQYFVRKGEQIGQFEGKYMGGKKALKELAGTEKPLALAQELRIENLKTEEAKHERIKRVSSEIRSATKGLLLIEKKGAGQLGPKESLRERVSAFLGEEHRDTIEKSKEQLALRPDEEEIRLTLFHAKLDDTPANRQQLKAYFESAEYLNMKRQVMSGVKKANVPDFDLMQAANKFWRTNGLAKCFSINDQKKRTLRIEALAEPYSQGPYEEESINDSTIYNWTPRPDYFQAKLEAAICEYIAKADSEKLRRVIAFLSFLRVYGNDTIETLNKLRSKKMGNRHNTMSQNIYYDIPSNVLQYEDFPEAVKAEAAKITQEFLPMLAKKCADHHVKPRHHGNPRELIEIFNKYNEGRITLNANDGPMLVANDKDTQTPEAQTDRKFINTLAFDAYHQRTQTLQTMYRTWEKQQAQAEQLADFDEKILEALQTVGAKAKEYNDLPYDKEVTAAKWVYQMIDIYNSSVKEFSKLVDKCRTILGVEEEVAMPAYVELTNVGPHYSRLATKEDVAAFKISANQYQTAVETLLEKLRAKRQKTGIFTKKESIKAFDRLIASMEEIEHHLTKGDYRRKLGEEKDRPGNRLNIDVVGERQLKRQEILQESAPLVQELKKTIMERAQFTSGGQIVAEVINGIVKKIAVDQENLTLPALIEEIKNARGQSNHGKYKDISLTDDDITILMTDILKMSGAIAMNSYPKDNFAKTPIVNLLQSLEKAIEGIQKN